MRGATLHYHTFYTLALTKIICYEKIASAICFVFVYNFY